jgi:hypothetical protein
MPILQGPPSTPSRQTIGRIHMYSHVFVYSFQHEYILRKEQTVAEFKQRKMDLDEKSNNLTSVTDDPKRKYRGSTDTQPAYTYIPDPQMPCLVFSCAVMPLLLYCLVLLCYKFYCVAFFFFLSCVAFSCLACLILYCPVLS